ncbi:sel1 repeat family protein [Paraferrimonas sp. SM1919]|uniref:sel1 repeat family protein n=1 Tax=Paraferrimonas sp. SM1919 TaxID=2662263 RepID=UPI0013D3C734|nr:sel1 repeat family protein [Paraferrimonas sp. SM1919]
MFRIIFLLVIPCLAFAGKLPSVAEDVKQSKIAWISFQAQRGDIDSNYAYGLLVLLGLGVQQDTELALEKLIYAADNGHQGAIEAIADLYFEDDYVNQDLAKAVVYYESLADPKSDKVNFRLGYIYSVATEVELDCNKALKYFALVDDITAMGNIVWLLATCPEDDVRNGYLAVKLGLKLVEQVGDDPIHLDNLAAAYAEIGDFTNALQWQSKAIAASDEQDEQAQAELQYRLEQYQKGLPYRMR